MGLHKGQGRRPLLDSRGLQALRRHRITHRHDSVIDITNGAFPLRGTTQLGTARYGMARLGSGWFAFPLQFSTVLEWARLFMRLYSCAASTAVTSS